MKQGIRISAIGRCHGRLRGYVDYGDDSGYYCYGEYALRSAGMVASYMRLAPEHLERFIVFNILNFSLNPKP